MTERKTVSKKVRFEVFKRDAFKCQYCGAVAPEVLLQLDHIQPVATGGSNDITNLITACAACNSGKGARTLNDHTVIAKQRAQLEELQERREQLEMLLKWKQDLQELKDDTLTEVCDYWHRLAPGFTISENGRRNVQKWLRRHSAEEVLHAMDIAAEQYLQFNRSGTVSTESWEEAFSKIPGICRVEKESRDDPEIKELYYIRGIARNNIQFYFDASKALQMLKIARSWDVPFSELRQIAVRATSWTKFRNGLYKAIEQQKGLSGESEDSE